MGLRREGALDVVEMIGVLVRVWALVMKLGFHGAESELMVLVIVNWFTV